MLKQVAEGVLVHESQFVMSNAVVVQGRSGVLLIDPGITHDEMVCLASDLCELGQSVVAGFSTHPHWDHLLWHAGFGEVPRYGTARCAANSQDLRSHADWRDRVAKMLPSDIADQIPVDLLGLITGLPAGTTHIPWDGPRVRIITHQAHVPGHAALLIENSGVFVTGDMLSDILVPFPDHNAATAIEDYIAALQLFEGVADDAKVLIPGHGSVGGVDRAHAQIKLDLAYMQALRDGRVPEDPRVGPSATFGQDWLPGAHERQAQLLIEKRKHDGASE